MYNYIKMNNHISGELVRQAERKVQPSTHLPDLDNANAGMPENVCLWEASLRRLPTFTFGGIKMVKINGESLDTAGKLLTEYLSEHGYDLKRVAVEINGEIVPKASYSQTRLNDGDTVEIVSFVGGG